MTKKKQKNRTSNWSQGRLTDHRKVRFNNSNVTGNREKKIKASQERAKAAAERNRMIAQRNKERRIKEGQERAKRAKAKQDKDAAFRKKRDSRFRTGKSISQRIRDNRARKKRELEEAKIRRKLRKIDERDRKRKAKADWRATPKRERIGGWLKKQAKKEKEVTGE